MNQNSTKKEVPSDKILNPIVEATGGENCRWALNSDSVLDNTRLSVISEKQCTKIGFNALGQRQFWEHLGSDGFLFRAINVLSTVAAHRDFFLEHYLSNITHDWFLQYGVSRGGVWFEGFACLYAQNATDSSMGGLFCSACPLCKTTKCFLDSSLPSKYFRCLVRGDIEMAKRFALEMANKQVKPNIFVSE